MDAFLTSTITVALAEMADKTQLLSLLLAAKFKNKHAIVLAILFSTIFNHAISAWLGTWISAYMTGTTGQWILSISFVAMAFWLLVPDKEQEEPIKFAKYGAFWVTPVLFFVAEIGDKTQIATVALAAKYHSILHVTLGTTLGMLIANVPVVYAGDAIMKLVPLKYARWSASLIFLIVGITVLIC